MPVIHTQETLQKVTAQAESAIRRAGEIAVAETVARMESGYGRPIRRTGRLMADVHAVCEGTACTVGNGLAYAPYVHEGTRRMAARPYLREAMDGAAARLRQTIEEELRTLDGMNA